MSSREQRKLALIAEAERHRVALAREWDELRDGIDAGLSSLTLRGGLIGKALSALFDWGISGANGRASRERPGWIDGLVGVAGGTSTIERISTAFKIGLSIWKLFRKKR